MEKKYNIKVVAEGPDGRTVDYYFNDLKEAVKCAGRIDTSRGWNASIWARIGRKWELL